VESENGHAGRGDGLSILRRFGAPIGVLVVVVAVICGLVLSGAIQPSETRTPATSPTTVPSIEITPVS
jgi:hypothetical protein